MQKSENSVKYGGFSLKNQHPMLKIVICEKSIKNVTTHQKIVQFGSFLDMLVLATSRIDFSVKILIFSFFSEKSRIFIKKMVILVDFWICWSLQPVQ